MLVEYLLVAVMSQFLFVPAAVDVLLLVPVLIALAVPVFLVLLAVDVLLPAHVLIALAVPVLFFLVLHEQRDRIGNPSTVKLILTRTEATSAPGELNCISLAANNA